MYWGMQAPENLFWFEFSQPNQMRDVFFEEVETDSPEEYVKEMLKGSAVQVHAEQGNSGIVTVFADCDGLIQKFIFTPI